MVYNGEELENEAPKPPTLPAWRFGVLRILVVLGFAILSAQLWRLQVVQGAEYRQQADLNRLRVVSVPASRGILYDRQGVLLARNIPSFTIAIVPADLPSAQSRAGANGGGVADEDVYRRLGALLQMNSAEIKERVDASRGAPFQPVVIRTNVERDTAFVVEEDHPSLPGVIVETVAVRQYLEGPLLAHLLGYVG